MGNCISTISDFCLNKVFQWIEEKGGYNYNLENNLVDLERAMEDLKAKREDYSRRLKREEDRGLQRRFEFQVWLDRVETIEIKVNALLSDKDVELQRLYVCGFCYGYGEKVILTLKEVEVLNSKVFDVIVDQAAQTFEVQKRPIQRIIVGQETMLETAWNHLMDDGVGTLGMYGMGGVGKTTLLKQINNKFSDERCGFTFVIWIVVSKELHIEKIQDEIAEKAGLGGEEWSRKDKVQKSVDLYNFFLLKKRFVLFLDDIWEKVELDEIGIPDPTPQNQCKVAFTSRSQDVCASMGAEKLMEVRCLTENEAFDLFQKKVGQTTLESDPGIPEFAKLVAKKCCGLPLALNIIGETMSGKKTIQEWRRAIHVLNSYAEEFSGMVDKILPLLKYSYDMLNGEHVKSCLLYCALFPEDAQISKEDLIEYWICEEIIDGNEGIVRAEDTGYEILGNLVSASLLMDEETTVYMHDIVREMALWIASDLGRQKEAFIVHAGVGLREIPKVKNWNVVRRMSLMENKINHLVGNPECLELTTLLLQDTKLKSISSEFFKYMPKLAVLDLSGNYLLSELPDGILALVSLQYLNLSDTEIRYLPKGLHELKKIIHLNLEYTSELESITGISSLHNLKVLKLIDSRFSWDLETVKELETLEHLEILTTIIHPGLEKFLSSDRLMSRTQFLEISGKTTSSPNRNLESSGISIPVSMDKLREFTIHKCCISEIKMGRICSFLSLVQVWIYDCQSLRELKFLMFAPNLKDLYVDDVKDLEDIINKEKACEVENSGIVPFQNLKELRLSGLPKLKNIYWSPRPFPCLEEIDVHSCESLRELTFLMFAPNLKSLHVFAAHDLEDIINKEKACEVENSGIVPFQNLKKLILRRLPKLKNIYWSPLPFPCLEEIHVEWCPNLRKLPLDSKSGKNGLGIKMHSSEKWIEGVEWEDEATKPRFLSSCIEERY